MLVQSRPRKILTRYPCRREGARIGVLRSVRFGLTAASLLLSGAFALAQNNSNSAPVATAPVHKHARKKPVALNQTASQPTPLPVPAAPPPPDWPAKNLPVDATVIFDSHGLMVSAQNSSLEQILKQVGAETGARIEGMNGVQADQRIFGVYGPGPARDVINELLDGSGYDVLMIGDRGEGTPRRIVLTVRSGAGQKSVANNTQEPENNEDSEPESAPEPQAEQEPPPQAEPGTNGSPVPVRTPQQMMQEIQERQRQLQNQQLQQQNGQQNPQD